MISSIMRPGPHIEIKLDQPELLVRGTFDEATPPLLSGRLIVHLPEPIRVRSLRLTFSGRIDTFLNQSSVVDAAVSRDTHREFLAHTWGFFTPERSNSAHTHSSEQWVGTREFPFDLLVGGDNPETIHTALGKVQYTLHALLERTAFHANLTCTAEVPVKRGPMPGAPWALALMESIEARGCWAEQLEYRITVPTRSLKDGELFHTRFEIEPRAKGMKLVAVGVLVKEYVRFYGARAQSVHRFARVVARNENYVLPSAACSVVPRRAGECMDLVDATSISIPLSIPDAYTHVQYDVATDVIEVRHRIKFLVKIRDPAMMVHSVFIAVPVSIMPVTARDDASILPRYENVVRNPGTVLLRSDTLPPAYDAAARLSDSGGGSRGVSARETVELPDDEDTDGFPTALRRGRSQFYLASPDHSPTLNASRATVSTDSEVSQAADSTDAEVSQAAESTDAEASPVSSSPIIGPPSHASPSSTHHMHRASHRSSLSSTTCNADSPLPSPLNHSEESTAASTKAEGDLKGDSETCMLQSRLAAKQHSLHNRLSNARIGDKVRSVFHIRSLSGHHHHHRRSMSGGGSHQPQSSCMMQRPCMLHRSVTPPPVHVAEHSVSPAHAFSQRVHGEESRVLFGGGESPVRMPPSVLLHDDDDNRAKRTSRTPVGPLFSL